MLYHYINGGKRLTMVVISAGTRAVKYVSFVMISSFNNDRDCFACELTRDMVLFNVQYFGDTF